MSINEIVNCAEALSKMFGLYIPDKRRLKKNLRKRIPVTTFYANEKFTLWIDKNYIAYSRNGYIDVWYLYITRTHIRAQLRILTAQLRNDEDFLSYIKVSNIREQMNEALRKMRITGMDSYFFYFNLEEIQKAIEAATKTRGGK